MKRILIKIGGELAGDEGQLRILAGDLGGLRDSSPCLMVHGGGAELTGLEKKMGLDPVFRDGIRITSPEEMPYVDMVLSGSINKRIVRIFQSCGINAVGISGSDGRTFVGTSIGSESRTAEISAIDTRLVELLLEGGYFPVISSTSMDGERGIGLNINADSAAFGLAGTLEVRYLVFLSNIPGILKAGKQIPSLSVQEASREIRDGTVTGGMIPKVKASIEALERGVEKICIGEFRERGDLEKLLSGRSGTQIHL